MKESLDMKESLYQAVAASSSDMISLISSDYRYLACNKKYSEVVGIPEKIIIGMSLIDVHTKALFDLTIRPHAIICMKNRKIITFEDWFNFETGRKFMEVKYFPYLVDNKVAGFIVNARNNTTRKQILDELIIRKVELEEKNSILAQINEKVTDANAIILSQHKKLETELKNKVLMISDYNQKMQKIKNIIAKIDCSPPITKDLNQIISSNANQRIIDEIDFSFLELNKSFFQHISTLTPSITAKSLKLCAYIKMNLSDKEIASLLYVSPASIKVAKNRLRKKLDIDSNAKLFAFLNSIV